VVFHEGKIRRREEEGKRSSEEEEHRSSVEEGTGRARRAKGRDLVARVSHERKTMPSQCFGRQAVPRANTASAELKLLSC